MAAEVASSPLRAAISACHRGLLWAALFSFAINLLLLALPLYILQIFDRVLPSRSVETLFVLFALAAGALAVLGILEILRGFIIARSGAWLDSRLGAAMLGEGIDAPPSHHTLGMQGLRDLATVRTLLTGAALTPIMDAPWTPIFILTIFLLHPALGWFALAGAVVLFSLALASELVTRHLLARAGGAAVQASADAAQAFRHADVVKAMGMTPAVLQRWTARNHAAVALELAASERAGVVRGTSRFLRLILQIGILTAGAWLVIRGELTAGGMTAASLLLARALAPVEHAIHASRALMAAHHAWRRLKSLLQTASRRAAPMPFPAPAGRLSVENLVFTHPGASAPIIRNLTLQLVPGETLGLIGPTAAGKTTLGQLMVGVLEPDSGHVRLDGIEVVGWQRDDLGRHIGYLPQEPALFTGSVRENIARLTEGDADAVIAAARLAGIHESIAAMPQGYDTIVGPGGLSLSGGQRQRIGLARALYGDPRLVVLDEPNAALDREGETALLAAMASLKAKAVTLIVIAHAPHVLRSVDSLLALRPRAVPLFGPRERVIAELSHARIARPTASAGRLDEANHVA